jgi:hypothetical protein
MRRSLTDRGKGFGEGVGADLNQRPRHPTGDAVGGPHLDLGRPAVPHHPSQFHQTIGGACSELKYNYANPIPQVRIVSGATNNAGVYPTEWVNMVRDSCL